MFFNYLKIAVRNLLKRKSYSLINILGLAAGMSVCLIIGKYILFETSYDDFHARARTLYRVNSSFYTDSSIDQYGGYDLGPSLINYFPEITSVTRIHANGSVVSFNHDGKQFKYQEPRMLFADSTFFTMFSFALIRGSQQTAFSDPYAIVITESIARKYYGSADPIGKVISLADGWVPGLYTISAVVQDVPVNSHFEFDFLIPMHNLLQTEFYRNNHARWDNFHTYVEISGAEQLTAMEKRVHGFIRSYRGTDKAINSRSRLKFQRLLAIHYSPDLKNEGSRQRTIYFFALIAVFVLAIAWINYINLSTARAMERAKEVGVKKAIGVLRSQLITQFCVESALINLVSLVISFGFAILLLPVLNDITGRSFSFGMADLKLLPIVVTLFAVGSFASGLYPAFVLSSYRTIEVIKGRIIQQRGGFRMRNGLVGFQFACSLLLLIVTFAVYRQVSFMQLREKGFETKQIVVLKGPELTDKAKIVERMISFKAELQQFSFVNKVCTSFSVPGDGASLSTQVRRLGAPVDENRIGNVYWVDPDFMALYDIPVVAGKTWNPAVKSEMRSAIINEEAVRIFQLGTNEAALSSKIIVAEDTLAILAVVKNHHWNSMKEPFTPMIFEVEKASATSISVQLNGNIRQALATIEQNYKSDFPDNPFSYYFLDDAYAAKYKDELEFEKLFGVFSILAVLLGCLGLWGLASFTTVYRLKEISIRKTLGASVNSVVMLLSGQFLKPLLIASILVVPLVWLGIERWLDKFPYRIAKSAELFLLPLATLIVISFAAVAFQTVKAARSNPVDSLKSE